MVEPANVGVVGFVSVVGVVAVVVVVVDKLSENTKAVDVVCE
jgi:hypothetical protein